MAVTANLASQWRRAPGLRVGPISPLSQLAEWKWQLPSHPSPPRNYTSPHAAFPNAATHGINQPATPSRWATDRRERRRERPREQRHSGAQPRRRPGHAQLLGTRDGAAWLCSFQRASCSGPVHPFSFEQKHLFSHFPNKQFKEEQMTRESSLATALGRENPASSESRSEKRSRGILGRNCSTFPTCP